MPAGRCPPVNAAGAGSSIEPVSTSRLAGLLVGWLGGWVAGTNDPASMSRPVDAGLLTCRLVADSSSSMIINEPESTGARARACIQIPTYDHARYREAPP